MMRFVHKARTRSGRWWATMVPQWAYQQTVTAMFTLPAGNRRAVRVQYRANAYAGECTDGAY